jgi:GT2 family glycosyltransferase
VHADVVVVNFHGAGDVAGCLAALGPWPHGTVWLVDNSADPAQAAALHAQAAGRAGARVLVNAANEGFGRGCNRAWALSDAPRVLLLNPDARIGAAAVQALDAALDADRRLAAVSPRTWWDAVGGFLLPPPDAQRPATALRPWALALRPGGAGPAATRAALRERRAAAAPAVREVPALAGALLLLDRDAVQAAGGLFDPGYFMFFEDADLSLRLRRSGRRLALVQAVEAVHATCHTAAKARLMQDGAQVFFGRHHRRFLRASGGLARTALPAALAARADVAGAGTPEPARSPDALGPLLAFSPSPQGWPALVRPAGAAAAPFSAAQWALLAPGSYRALVPRAPEQRAAGGASTPAAPDAPDPPGGLRWVSFEKPAGG